MLYTVTSYYISSFTLLLHYNWYNWIFIIYSPLTITSLIIAITFHSPRCESYERFFLFHSKERQWNIINQRSKTRGPENLFPRRAKEPYRRGTPCRGEKKRKKKRNKTADPHSTGWIRMQIRPLFPSVVRSTLVLGRPLCYGHVRTHTDSGKLEYWNVLHIRGHSLSE